MFEITVDAAAMADLGIPVDDLDFGVEDLPPDPLADQYDARYEALYETAPVDGGSMRAAIDRVVGIRHQQSELQAEEYRALARLSALAREGAELVMTPEAGDLDAKEVAYRTMVAEVAMVTRVSARTMTARIADAELIATQFPHTLEELAVGSIGAGHVRVIVQHGYPLVDDQVRAVYESIVLKQAVQTTPGRLRRLAELTAAKLGTETFQERHDRRRRAYRANRKASGGDVGADCGVADTPGRRSVGPAYQAGQGSDPGRGSTLVRPIAGRFGRRTTPGRGPLRR